MSTVIYNTVEYCNNIILIFTLKVFCFIRVAMSIVCLQLNQDVHIFCPGFM